MKTALAHLLQTPAAADFGATIIHMIWEGALVGAALALLQPLLRHRSTAFRYGIACTALFSLPALFAVTWVWMHVLSAPGLGWTLAVAGLQHVAPLLPYLALAWAVGAAAMALHALGGWLWLQRTCRRVERAVPQQWLAVLERLRLQLGVRASDVALSSAVEGPCVAGWFRPLILLPLSALASLPLDQLEALLAHELAHIRRHDYLVNLLQRAVEVLFFFHPAAWWISTQVRECREQCCDDLAIAACGDRLQYARALVELAAWRSSLALAASGGSLAHRVRRILTRSAVPARSSARFAAAMAAVALAAGLAGLPSRAPALRPAATTLSFTSNPRPQLVAERIPLASAPVNQVRHKWAKARIKAAPLVTPDVAAADLDLQMPPAALPAVPAPQQARLEITWVPAGQACSTHPEIVQQFLPNGQVWIGVRSVMECQPVMQPVAVWVLTT